MGNSKPAEGIVYSGIEISGTPVYFPTGISEYFINSNDLGLTGLGSTGAQL
jgi:hypothetical protein